MNTPDFQNINKQQQNKIKNDQATVRIGSLFLKRKFLLYIDKQLIQSHSFTFRWAKIQLNKHILGKYRYSQRVLYSFFLGIRLSSKYDIQQLKMQDIRIPKRDSKIEDQIIRQGYNYLSIKQIHGYKQAFLPERMVDFQNILKTLSFTNFPQLVRLNLAAVQIQSIEIIAFLKCPNLISLKLDNNHISSTKSLSKMNFHRLISISLTFNPCVYMPNSRVRIHKYERVLILSVDFSSIPYDFNMVMKYQVPQIQFKRSNCNYPNFNPKLYLMQFKSRQKELQLFPNQLKKLRINLQKKKLA